MSIAARHALACSLAREGGVLALRFFADRGALTVDPVDFHPELSRVFHREVSHL